VEKWKKKTITKAWGKKGFFFVLDMDLCKPQDLRQSNGLCLIEGINLAVWPVDQPRNLAGLCRRTAKLMFACFMVPYQDRYHAAMRFYI